MTLKKLRKNNKIQQKELASFLNIKQNSYSQYESGNRTPNIEQIPKLANALNVTIEEIVISLIETKKEYENGRKEKI